MIFNNRAFLSVLIVLFSFGPIFPSIAHPIPDLPVFGSFDGNGTSKILIEIDPRGFAENPEAESFLTSDILNDLNISERNDLLQQATELVEESLLIRLNEEPWNLPAFEYGFSKPRMVEFSDEPIILLEATAKLSRKTNSTYQIKAKESAPLDLIFANRLNGVPHRRVNVLFPGEESFALRLPQLKSMQHFSDKNVSGPPKLTNLEQNDYVDADTWSTFTSFLRQGFLHVLPLGLDHILFVLGLFLLSRKFKVLIYQISIFTLAHTLTLGLATLGLISVPSTIVEPIIAASIAFVALENIFFPTYHPRRLIIIFVFGLIHGLGFAGALSDLNLNPSILILSLIGFNLGVEGGQLAVILLSFIGVYRFKNEDSYRKGIVIPLSLIIAGLGIYWAIERIWNG
ncbi:MAG: HupE/UreJ family protein [Opitutales bacterium]|nr:HupE/UreJ family protein [Opitutales bacterium]